MNAAYLKKLNILCPSCGAPITAEICPYCGTATGYTGTEEDLDFPVLECREFFFSPTDSFFALLIPAIFIFGGLAVLLVFWLAHNAPGVIIFTGPFIVLGICFAVGPARQLINYIQIKHFGKMLEAMVFGYMEDKNVTVNGRKGQIVKLLINTEDGPRFLLYQLRSTMRPFGLHEIVELRAYKDFYFLCNSPGIDF